MMEFTMKNVQKAIVVITDHIGETKRIDGKFNDHKGKST